VLRSGGGAASQERAKIWAAWASPTSATTLERSRVKEGFVVVVVEVSSSSSPMRVNRVSIRVYRIEKRYREGFIIMPVGD
jgi:hypothetical protein